MTKNKKGLEMSINTIVIIVIAVTMLILGLVLVRTIMCGAMNLAATTNEGALNQINKLFSEQQGEDFTCMGVTSPMDIVPGNYNVVGCGFKSTTPITYSYTYTIEGAQSADGTNILNEVKSTWVQGALTSTSSVTPGRTVLGSFIIRPPSDAPEGLITVKATIRKGTGAAQTETLYFNVKRVGLVQKGVC